MKQVTQKIKIHYHSDCYFFSGSENMVANFLNSSLNHEKYEISFSYRYSKEYEIGLLQRVKKKLEKYPLRLICGPTILKNINDRYSKFTAKIFKVIYFVSFFEYFIFIWNFLRMLFFFSSKKIDILHLNNGGYPAASSASPTIIAARIFGIKKIVYVSNNMATPYTEPLRWFHYPIDLLVKRFVSIFVTGSERARKRLIKVLNLKPHKVVKIFNGIANRELKLEKNDFKKQFDCLDKVSFGMVANFEKRKGHIYLLKAVKILVDQGLNDFIVLIEGEGLLRKEFQEFIDQNEIQNQVKLIGRLDYVFDLMNGVDVFVLPSIANEDFPNVILEAMNFSCPVIGTDIAGIPEQIIDNETGFVVEPKNPEKLAEKMKIFLLNKDALNMMGDKGKRRFEQCFSEKISLQNYFEIYKNLLTNEGKES